MGDVLEGGDVSSYELSHRLDKRLAAINSRYEAFVSNKAFTDYFGCTSLDNLLDYVHPDEVVEFKNFIDTFDGNYISKAFRFRLTDGTYRYNILKLISDRLDIEGGRNINIEMVDIDSAVSVNESLVNDINRVRMLLGMTDEYTFTYNRVDNMFILYRYEQYQRTTLYYMDIDEWKRFIIDQGYISEEDIAKFSTLISEIKCYTQGISININTSLRTQSDIKENLRFNAMVYNNSKMEKIMVGRILFAEQANQQSTLKIMDELHIDSLTGIFNKKSITDYAVKAIETAKNNRVTIVILDVDHFKTINDTYGHLYGDKVLSRIGNKLKDIVGEEGVVGRIGGDEFMIVLNGINDDQILRSMLRAIRTQIKWEFSGDFEDFLITCSLGAAICPNNGKEFEELFKKADYCLYIAKDKGRDRYVFFRDELHAESYKKSMVKKDTGNLLSYGREVRELKFMRDFMRKAVVSPRKAFDMAQEHMLKNYHLDSINVFYGPGLGRVRVYGKELPYSEDAAYMNTEEFTRLLDGREYFQVGFVGTLMTYTPGFYSIMSKRKVTSTVQCIIGTPEHVLGLVTFDRCAEASQWADYEVDCAVSCASLLSIICKGKEC